MTSGFLRSLFGKRQASVAPASDTSEPIDRTATAERIEDLTRGGFETAASTLETIVDEYLTPEEIVSDDRRWIEVEVERAFQRKRADEATWPAITDFDRLDAAFEALETSGIVALHCAGYTRSDGISDAWEAYHQLQEAGASARGYVFYHGQDVEAVVADRGLYLAFGAFDDRDETARGIAGEIIAAVNAQDLPAQWEGDVNVRILVWPIEWRKRSPAED